MKEHLKKNNHMKSIIAFLLLAIVLISCAPKKVDTAAEAEKLMQISRDWSQLISSKDTEKILSYWSDDAVLYSPGEAPVKGKDALRTMVAESFNNPGFSISWEPIEAHVSDDGSMGYLIEQNKVTINDSTIFYGNALTVWQKSADGTWKNVAEMSTPKPQ
jgi:ketosteroid isomerase-like protein